MICNYVNKIMPALQVRPRRIRPPQSTNTPTLTTLLSLSPPPPNPPASQSRCTRFRFAPLRPEQISGRLQDICTAERINITPGGQQALLELSGGDLRRVLNLLQSAHMTCPEISEEVIYLTAGAAQPAVIEAMLQSLLTDTFNDAYDHIVRALTEYGYALVDINTALSLKIAGTDLPDAVTVLLMDRLSNIEYR